MSLEAKIEANTAAILKLIAVLESKQQVTAAPVAPVVAQTAPVVAPASTAVEVKPELVSAMPSLPTFTAPVAQAVPANAAPFTDSKGLIEYVMKAYQAMGAEKGAKIQGVLVSLGYANINDVKPDHYGALYAGVEALK